MTRRMSVLSRRSLVLMMFLILVQVGAIMDSASSYLFDWNPAGQPSFVDTPSHVRVKRGALAVLHCWIRQLGDRQVAWRRKADDTFLTIGKVTLVRDSNIALENVRKRSGVTTWDLIFRQARPENEGEYECQVTSQETYVRTVTLTVLDEPIYSSHLELATGEPLQLRCNISSFNTSGSALYWEKDGRHIDSVLYPFIYITRYQLQYTRTVVSDLTIDNVSLEDSGLYTCMTSSRHVLRVTKITVTGVVPSTNKREENPNENMSAPSDERLGQQVHPKEHDSDSVHNSGTLRSSQQGTHNRAPSESGHRVWQNVIAFMVLRTLLSLVVLPRPSLLTPGT